jgi:hypothetical protein
MPLLIHPPHRVDLTLGDWRVGAVALVAGADDRAARASLEARWSPAGDGLAFLSVRSALDCALTALAWPAGSEILLSAVNIREMVDVLRAHGLVPVPLPLERATMQPSADAIDRAVTRRTRGLLVAHLFGARADVGPLLARARARGLVTFEDAAQAFADPADRGHPLADVALFSFGTLKTATALGGALVRIADPVLVRQMAAIQAGWPVQSRRAYGGKLVRALGFLALQRPLPYTLFLAAARLIGRDGGALIRRMTRGFTAAEPAALGAALRRRPSRALLVLLDHRLASVARTADRLAARRRWGAEVAAAAEVAGAAHPDHTHWLLPVRVADVAAARVGLRAAGIDVSGASNVVDLAPGSRGLEGIVFVPAYPELPRRRRRRVLASLPGAGARPC